MIISILLKALLPACSYKVYSLRWELSSKYSKRRSKALYLSQNSHQERYRFIQMKWQCFKCFIVISKHCCINCQMNPYKYNHVFFCTLFFNHISLIAMAKRIQKLKWNKANYKELANYKIPVSVIMLKDKRRMDFTQLTF